MNDTVLAIIPAKSRSRRVSNKNMRLFNGKPLLYHTIEQALRSRMINEVYVSTESPEIQRYAEECGARVPFLRPIEMTGDSVHGSVPILDMLEKLGGAAKYSHCVQLLATSPLRRAETIDAVVQMSIERHANVLSVTPTGRILAHYRTLGSDGYLQKVDQQTGFNFQTDDMPEVYCINGVVYCAPVEPLLLHRTFQYGNPVGFPMNPIEAADIDTETDFVMAENWAKCLEQRIIRL